MIASPTSLAVDLADAVRRQAVAAGSDTPAVRGADWRLATVATVNGDGTIVTSDGITARRGETYTLPAVSDQIIITQSSAGNWLAVGRLATGTDTEWRTYTPTWTAGTTNPTLGNGTITGRYARHGQTCHVAIRLVPGSSTGFGSGSYLFSLPVTSSADPVEYVGTARLTAGSTYIGQCFLGAAASTMNATFPASATPATAANMTQAAPATFASGHVLRLNISYQTA